MINCTQLFLEHISFKPALILPDGKSLSFHELKEMAAGTQNQLRKLGIQAGDAVCLFDAPGPRLFAAIVGIMAMGCRAIFVEPWMTLPHLKNALNAAKPKVFLTSPLGRLWGLRSLAVRQIPNWASISSKTSSDFTIEEVPEETPAIITFTTGTTGAPKGVIRSHSYLLQQLEAITKNLGLSKLQGPDLCLFGNFVLANLAQGRTSVIVPQKPKRSFFKNLAGTKAVSLTAGPAFLKQMIDYADLPTLSSIHIGGALTDCDTFEEGFNKWPNAHFLHVYGSSEVEPVSVSDAKEAVRKSREEGFFQTLYLGNPIDEIDWKLKEDSLWVSGGHVCPAYIGDDEANRKNKVLDSAGKLWHRMGDRIAENEGFWYHGRSHMQEEDFLLEQKIYTHLQSSACFIHRDKHNKLYLIGEKIPDSTTKTFANLTGMVDTKIYRDRRHSARLDREKTLKKGAPWLVG